MAGTKLIRGARVAVLRLDGVSAGTAAEGLKALGLSEAVGLSSLTELCVHIEGGKVDVVVIAAADVASGEGALPAPPAAVRAGVPCLLLTSALSRAATRAALSAGYAAVVSADAGPRMVYRRVGALMQRVRRLGRARLADEETA